MICMDTMIRISEKFTVLNVVQLTIHYGNVEWGKKVDIQVPIQPIKQDCSTSEWLGAIHRIDHSPQVGYMPCGLLDCMGIQHSLE